MESTRTQHAYDYIRRRLASGEIAPGAHLVNRKLAGEIGASIIPVREAISRLVSEGLLQYTPGAGAFVREPSPAEIGQIYDLRELLEPGAAEQAARSRSEDESRALDKICRELRSLIEEIDRAPRRPATREQVSRWADAGQRFHELVIRASGNDWLIRIVGTLALRARIFHRERHVEGMLAGPAAATTLCNHTALLDAIRERDPEAARASMARLIRAEREAALAHLRSPAAPSPAGD
jgi:DNA-binding GntR family transcriptional regulator